MSESILPLRTGRRKQSWEQAHRSRCTVHSGGTDMCTSVSAGAWAGSWWLPWLSFEKHSNEFTRSTTTIKCTLGSKHQKSLCLSLDSQTKCQTSQTNPWQHILPQRWWRAVSTPFWSLFYRHLGAGRGSFNTARSAEFQVYGWNLLLNRHLYSYEAEPACIY